MLNLILSYKFFIMLNLILLYKFVKLNLILLILYKFLYYAKFNSIIQVSLLC